MTTTVRTVCDVTATVGETGCVGNRSGQASRERPGAVFRRRLDSNIIRHLII